MIFGTYLLSVTVMYIIQNFLFLVKREFCYYKLFLHIKLSVFNREFYSNVFYINCFVFILMNSWVLIVLYFYQKVFFWVGEDKRPKHLTVRGEMANLLFISFVPVFFFLNSKTGLQSGNHSFPKQDLGQTFQADVFGEWI